MFGNQNGRQNKRVPRLEDFIEDVEDDWEYEATTYEKPDNTFLNALFREL